ncbi:Sec-independent protein translocase protein TatB [Thiobacillus sp.]|uniref:Sec-independent protein translocase protein TatB n=1 Tax=Thiobacillus sp. TaxID=924 RepID=UPI0017A96DE3|nr:Sec-independent protein translocase protein TatB [Thiobacillus sp.]MBC2729212.1 twin-arginine translocase subunit TatB [Thiobacillus sp.]MBC2737947.1 twin-arginine translocase subunit TatB [Thiobacillus sp.]MBC2759541.1 twin-arginine translocase subunit TatB [Thiobacillus sp.]
MFDIGFSELVVIGVVALIVIGPERLPKVARTAGHLYGRLQRYVSSVKSDIGREIQLDELRRAGQSFKESVESAASGVEQQATVVDDFLRKEANNVTQAVTESVASVKSATVAEPTLQPQSETEHALQQSLPLDEPDQNTGRAAPASAGTASSESAGKSA